MMRRKVVFLKIILIVAVGEVAVMLFLNLFQISGELERDLLDMLLLTVFSAPFLYLFVVRPVMRDLSQKAELELKVVSYELEHAREATRETETISRMEQEWRRTFDSMKDVIWILDKEHRVLQSNAASERIFHRPREEVVGQHCCLIVHGSAQPISGCPVLQTRETLQRATKEVQVGADWFEITVDPILDADGRYNGAVHAVRDITEGKRATNALRESEDRYRDLVDHSQELICTHDLKGRILSANPWAATILGYSREELLRMNLRDFVVPEAREDIPTYLDKIREDGSAQGLLLIQTREGKRRIWEYNNSLRTEGVPEPIVRGMAKDITERAIAEKTLLRLKMAVDQISEAIVIMDTEGNIEYINSAFENMSGLPQEEVVGRNMRSLKSGEQNEESYHRMWESLARGESWAGNFIKRKKDGTLYEEQTAISPIRSSSGKIINFVAVKRDMTRERTLQKQLQTAQRMESVGTLAGGIAHDFNNALTGILGYTELLRLRIADDPEGQQELDEISSAAERAATLTRQLLTFARRQMMEPVNLALSDVVEELTRFLTKVVGAHVEVKTLLSADTPTVLADRGQIEQVIMNLCLNARDAMPQGGQLVVEARGVDVGVEHVRKYPYMKEGRYALLSVSDTGIGMDEATREKIFEPFFTTKAPDKGTGLGLSVVYGIVKQHNGFIHVFSEPGKGSIFRIHLPAIDTAPDVRVPAEKEEVRGGTETILLAEDEEGIRGLAERILIESGYSVLAAKNGEEAVGLFRRHQGEISLAVMDVVMPRKGGKEAYEEICRQSPNLKVIFMSGYSANAVHEGFVIKSGTPFLGKPFGPTVLLKKVREVLDKA